MKGPGTLETGSGRTAGWDLEELARLVKGAQRGDALAMDELLGAVAPYIGRICGPVALQDGADAAQETLIAVFRNLRQLRTPAAFLGWVRAIAVREAVKLARNRVRQGTPLAELEERPGREEPQLASDIADAMGRLSPEHRVVLTLRHVDGLNEQEVARILAVPVGTVRSRLFRARRSFRDAWG